MVVDQSLVCYIQDINTKEMVTFNIEKPQGYTDSYTANFQQQDVRGRSSPFQSYTNSGPRQITFSILLSLDYRRELAEHTNKVRSILKPYSKSSGLIVPPRVKVVIGKALNITAIPVSFSAEWSEGYKEGVYRICTWNFTFTEVEESSSRNTLGGDELRSYVPAGLDYVIGNLGQPPQYTPGAFYEVNNQVISYETANEANNYTAVNPTEVVEPGQYYVYCTSGDAVNITTQPGRSGRWIMQEK